jgi:hypothetical protein
MVDEKKIKELVEAELAPVQARVKELEEQNTALTAENVSLKENVTKLESEKTEAGKKLENAISLSEKLQIRNKKMIKETKFMAERAKKAIVSARAKVSEDKEAFIARVSTQLEEHINEVTNSAFKSARNMFEKHFSSVEKDVMQELGRILAPYISDPSTPAKISKIEENAKSAIREVSSKVSAFRNHNKVLENKVNALVGKLTEAKLALYQEKLVSKLPSHLQESARVNIGKAKDPSEMQRIYMSVLRESTIVKPEEKPEVVEPKANEKKGSPVMKETKKPSVKKEVPAVKKTQVNPEDAVVFDPEVIKMALKGVN